ncbi:N-acetylmuramoyl-L-alanine amidase family protein [Salegentibacter salegens]|uniref:N-acetylmuramoyl-L-alanine amidase n=1 Tax=Salegentibacter salegens TaxID=143223 RepID=A0A1M7J555_9FLAO|nr:N-acetylmuramoyl-L-alanine amidase [Salegentibacter salegens]PRX47360.1 N-acetylmuramoyl-L-alanine amidase [Salegentibacter salegens]SHM47993.1 N-acetylmuramoyl-L-alanine amidase [Salegentibacter salegens]
MRTNLLKLFVFFFIFIASLQNLFADNEKPRDRFVVVLDAGHGGKDPGNMGNGFKEKDIALNIILKIGKALEKQEGIEVIYTRDTDVFIPLDKRAQIANEADADLFVSVHCNSHNSQAYGTETFVLGLHKTAENFEVAKKENSVIFLEEDYEVTYGGFNPNSPESYIGMALMQEEYLNQSILLADFVQKNFTNELKRKNRGVKQAGFVVLKMAVMPSVLIETGFLTNNHEGPYLNSTGGQNKMAAAIVEAIDKYANTINLSNLESIETTSSSITSTQSQIYEGITFKIQLAAGSKRLETKPYNFKGLENVERAREERLYKYYYGATSDYLKINELHNKAKQNGYPASYIVAFKDGSKITVNEALKSKVN